MKKLSKNSFTENKQIVYKLFIYLSLTILSINFDTILAQSIQDLQRIRAEYERFQRESRNLDSQPKVDNLSNSDSQSPKLGVIKLSNPTYKEIKHFGYDFLNRTDSLLFWDNLPAVGNYLLGPGDQLIITLWGATQLRRVYKITRDGKIYDDKVGLLNLSGKTIEEAQVYLKSQFARIYSTLIGKNPTTYFDISLGDLKSINVNFVGEVKYPGIYPIHPFSSLITGIMQVGGIDTTGSLRSILINRNNKLLKEVDLYQFFLNGTFDKNIQLRDQDVIIVPARKSIIKIDSAVTNPGIYESLAGETIFDLIKFAGGRTFDASESIILKSLLPLELRAPGYNYESKYINYSESKNIKINSGDHIVVPRLMTQVQQVEIIGQIKNPGKYPFTKNMKLSELFEISSGFNDSTFWNSVYQYQGEIIRRNPKDKYDEIIQFNLSEIKERTKDFNLQNLDRVIIHANLNFFEKDNIVIEGEVNIPGSYPLNRDNESLLSIINRAGGFTNSSYIDGIEIYRDSLRVAWKNLSISLVPGDSIFVKQKPGVVFVTGEVYNPSLIEFKSKKSLKYYLNSVGGLTKQGDIKDIIVIYPNGEVVPRRRFNNPDIIDGCTIIVNAKEIKEPFNPTQFANTALSLVSSLVTIAVLSQQIN